jgi:hypothetical protein
VQAVAKDEHELDEPVVDPVDEDRDGESRERQRDARDPVPRPGRESEAGAERRREDGVMKDGRAEEVAARKEDVEAGLEAAAACAVDEEEKVLGEREADADRGAVDDSVGHALEHHHAQATAEPSSRTEDREQREALRDLLDERGRHRVAEDDPRVVAEQLAHGAVADERDRRGAGRAP